MHSLLFNLRDLGGLPTVDGGTLRRGMVYRSGAFCDLDASASAAFEALGLNTILDLRSAFENDIIDCKWMTRHGAARINVPDARGAGGHAESEVRAMIKTWTPENAKEKKQARYLDKPAGLAKAVGVLFDCLAEDVRTPILFHCTAGSDRTGFVAAALQEALGVTRPALVEDYVISNNKPRRRDPALTQHLLDSYGLNPDTAEQVGKASRNVPEFILTALGVVDEQYGGIEAYLTGACGVSAQTLAAVRARLIIPAGETEAAA